MSDHVDHVVDVATVTSTSPARVPEPRPLTVPPAYLAGIEPQSADTAAPRPSDMPTHRGSRPSDTQRRTRRAATNARIAHSHSPTLPGSCR